MMAVKWLHQERLDARFAISRTGYFAMKCGMQSLLKNTDEDKRTRQSVWNSVPPLTASLLC